MGKKERWKEMEIERKREKRERKRDREKERERERKREREKKREQENDRETAGIDRRRGVRDAPCIPKLDSIIKRAIEKGRERKRG